jgi:L-amino acid N-acyltransferase YncA
MEKSSMATTPKATVRPAVPSDIPSITEIHAHYTLKTVITFKTEVTTSEQQLENLVKIHAQKLPYLVAVLPSSPSEMTSNSEAEHKQEPKVIGYTYVSGFRSKKAGYIHTVELSLFVHPSHLYGGTGTMLLKKLIGVLSSPAEHAEYYPKGIRSEEERVRQVIACMAVNVDSKEEGLGLKRWYEGFGFVFSGLLKEVGFKFGKWSVYYFSCRGYC